MNTTNSWSLLVFRDGRRTCNAGELLNGLSRQIKNVCSISDPHSQHARDELIDALLRAGELECALADEGMVSERVAADLSDELARALIAQQSLRIPDSVLQGLAAIQMNERLSISRPEGFCYYALHPLDYIDALAASDIRPRSAAVIGIRSIGTTLSAVVRAWLQQQGILAERITVRPSGHPFDRKLTLDSTQQQWIRTIEQRGAIFLIVDEGPGLSGSSFLSVAEALLSADVQPERIILLPSVKPDLASLIAENAASRWSKFRTLPLRPTRYIPSDATQRIDAGAWRLRVFESDSHWPGVWGWTERQKYWSADRQRIFRFDGHGHYGKAVRRRSEILAEHGLGPDIVGASDGFSVSPWVQGMPAGQTIDRQVLIQLARYCAFRAEHFKCGQSSQAGLEEMTRINLERALGVSHAVKLPLERPVIADGRMMPHEWIRSSSGRLLKVDASSHGDDHFYPGPTDIAWDIAGAIAEWELDKHASELLISEYERASADNIATRFSAYLAAYCAFRIGFTMSAAISVRDEAERRRFEREAESYRRRLSGMLQVFAAA